MVCLGKPVLHASLSAPNHLRGNSMENMDNSSYRFAGCKQYTFWLHNYLGKGVCKVIPSCTYGQYEMSTRQIMMSMYLLWRVKKMKSAN